MLVTYNAPNRAHHYAYATALARAGVLQAFVSGFSRFSPRAALPEVGGRLVRADHVQNFFLASQRLRLPGCVSEELAYWSKLWMDRRSERPALKSDVFLYYNGAGLRTTRRLASTPVACVVELVNSHVLVQQRLMREEYERLGLPFTGFHARDVATRVEEYRLCDAMLCPSRFVKDSLVSEGLSAEKILTVPYGFTLQPQEHTERSADGVFRVLYVGLLSVRKGVRYLIEAFDKLRHPRKELWLVGPATGTTGLNGVRIPKGVRFVGVLKGDNLAEAYRTSHVFVLPSIEDGFGLVVGEALSYGLPVITTRNSGGADIVDSGREGFVVPIRDSGAIFEKLQMLSDDPALLSQMAEAAFIKARTLGGWEVCGNRLVEALAKVRKTTSR